MADYLLIESRDPFESNDTAYFYDLAERLAHEGNKVSLFLVQNGVFPARRSTRSSTLSRLAITGVELLADDFSLRERGIRNEKLIAEVRPAPLDFVIDCLAEGRKTLWH
jgi:sulfur relay (sulfurtransferase) complex TusBCD TusD component (DsrE family)